MKTSEINLKSEFENNSGMFNFCLCITLHYIVPYYEQIVIVLSFYFSLFLAMPKNVSIILSVNK